MASITLKVTPDELKKKSGDISKSITEIESDFDKIEQVITGTRKYWEGEASNQHIKSYTKMKEEIETIIKRLKEHPKDLESMAGIYQENEQAVQKLAATLPADLFD